MANGLRLEEVRGLDAFTRRTEMAANILALFAQNAPTAIDPDDAAAIGVAPRLAREDHQHAFTSGIVDALTKTATSAEGGGSAHARATHTHATSALPWGIVARQTLTTGEASAHTATGDTDFTLTPTVDAARLYVVHLESQWLLSAAGTWSVEFRVGGVDTLRLDTIQTTAGVRGHTSGACLWEPASGTPTVVVRVSEAAGAGDLTYEATATVPRYFWIEDIGPR